MYRKSIHIHVRWKNFDTNLHSYEGICMRFSRQVFVSLARRGP